MVRIVEKRREVKIGSVFGDLKVIGNPFAGPQRKQYRRIWSTVCECSCGVITVALVDHLMAGNTKSCGCQRRKRHGLSRHKIYAVWRGMIQRCHNPANHGYRNYGGRGIFVCDKWKDNFDEFYEWSISHGHESGKQLDRINNNRGYSPENCRYVTPSVNGRNRRDNHHLHAWGETKTIASWAEDERCVVDYFCLSLRIRKCKWEPERAISTPSRNHPCQTNSHPT